MSDSRRALEVALISWLGAAFIRLLRMLVRVEYHGEGEIRRREREGERFLLAFWHRHLLLMPYAYRGSKISILISQHRDGELIARTMAHFGHHSSRGSSTRGGAAGMRELLRRFKEGYDLAITPDGPKGPARVAKAGAAQLAALAGVPIIPVAMAASRAKLLASWDRFVIPKPFCRVCFVYGEPLTVDRHEDAERAAERLTEALNQAERRAEQLAGTPQEVRCAA
ncbi:MAG TPA: lysophospholipid acyltransferase family protein [Thermoanaerobaculia bacterium]|nr:lysophospholipid acyltransferase family protein [Thermoanaerobaculia bacterium]